MDIACADCGYDGDEYAYMVIRSIWEAGGGGKACLCVACLEARLGRRLKPADFDWTIPLNWSPLFDRSERLRSRMEPR